MEKGRLQLVREDGSGERLGCSWHVRDEAPDEMTLKYRRIRAARNRWSLALLLLRNPSLRQYRKHRLFVFPEKEDDEASSESLDIWGTGTELDIAPTMGTQPAKEPTSTDSGRTVTVFNV